MCSPADPLQLVRIQSAYLPGFNPAIASSLRDGPVRSLAPAFAALGRRASKEGTRVLLVWVSIWLHLPSLSLLPSDFNPLDRARQTRLSRTATPPVCAHTCREQSS